MAKQFSYDKKPMGINKDRGCTDIIFLILFIAFWIGMWAVAVASLNIGDPRRLLY